MVEKKKPFAPSSLQQQQQQPAKLKKRRIVMTVQPTECQGFLKMDNFSSSSPPPFSHYSIESGQGLNLTCMTRGPHRWHSTASLFQWEMEDIADYVEGRGCLFAP